MESRVVIAAAVVLVVQLVALPVPDANGLPTDLFFSKVLNRIPGLRPSSKLEWTFSVLLEEPLKPFEVIGITGDVDFLGEWTPSRALILNKSDLSTTWSGTVRVPANKTINYRIFVGVNSSAGVQVRKWETHLEGRTLEVASKSGSTVDIFGVVGGQKEVKRGWLNTGYIMQFKLFRNPIQLNELSAQKIFVKVTPVDYDLNAKLNLFMPILPSGRADVEYVRMQYGNSILRDQPEYGVPYEAEDIVVFHITTTDLEKIAYRFTIYASDQQKPEVMHTIGFQYLLPEAINATSGSTELVLMSPSLLSSVGVVKVGYLVVKPLPTLAVSAKTSFNQYWRKNWIALDVGHRGLGKSLKVSTNAAPIIENTVASMKESGVRGTDMVEFDVQLTSDLIPVIYHDFFIYVCMNPKTPTSKEDLTEVLIKDLTYEQLKTLTTYQVIGSKIVEYPAHNSEPRKDYRLFPLFEEFLTEVNQSVGFDIEIKWPQQRSNGKFESIQTIDQNVYVDRILDVMLRKGCGRLSFFSSFDADICTLLRFKQNMYPVTFLGPSSDKYYVDPRSDNLKQSINNAQAFDLLGIVPHTSNFVKDPTAVRLATDMGKQIFLWGDDSSSTEMVKTFKSYGSTGVIYDRLDLLIPEGKVNAFSQEEDLPQFFQQQCVYSNVTKVAIY